MRADPTADATDRPRQRLEQYHLCPDVIGSSGSPAPSFEPLQPLIVKGLGRPRPDRRPTFKTKPWLVSKQLAENPV